MIGRVTMSLLLVVVAALVVVNQRTITRLGAELEFSQERISDLEGALLSERAKIAVLNKFVLTNHKTIKGMQRRKMLTVTAYSPRARETDSTPNITATNRRVRPGIVAVSRDLFDEGWVFGKKVYIKNHGVFVIDDLMHRRKKNQVDVFMTKTEAALQFGRKKLEVYLLDS